jgi:hypothetical protein
LESDEKLTLRKSSTLDASARRRYSSAVQIHPTSSCLKLTLVCILPLLLSGCVNLPDDNGPRGVKLSDAMQSSANGDRHDLGGTSSTPEVQGTVTAGMSGIADLTELDYDKPKYSFQIPFDVSYDMPLNSVFLGITHFTLTPLSYEDERNFFGLYVGGAAVQFQPGSLPDRAVDRTWMLDSGLSYRRHLNSSWPALSPYVTASAGFVMLNWHYKNSIEAGGDTISSDSLLGGEGMIGLGLSTKRNSRLSFFGEVGIGVTVFAGTTSQGFDNDVFNGFGFLSVKAGLSLKF